MKAAAEDPEFLRMVEKTYRAVGPLLGRRQYAKDLAQLGFYYYVADRYAEAVAVFDEVTTRRRPRRDVFARMLAYQAYSHWCLGDDERAVHAAAEGVTLLEPLAAADPGVFGEHLLQARWVLAVGRHNLGESTAAVSALEQYLRMARAAPVNVGPAVLAAERMLVTVLLDLDRPVDALPHAEEVVRLVSSEEDETAALARESECRARAAEELRASIRPLAEEGRLAEAREAGAMAIRLYRLEAETDDEYAMLAAQVHWALGSVGTPAERLADLEKAVVIWRTATWSNRLSYASMLAGMLVDTASCLAENGRDGQAAAEEAVALRREGVRDAPAEHTDVFADRLAEAEATLRRVRGGQPRPGR